MLWLLGEGDSFADFLLVVDDFVDQLVLALFGMNACMCRDIKGIGREGTKEEALSDLGT